jgi:hypothetical protein
MSHPLNTSAIMFSSERDKSENQLEAHYEIAGRQIMAWTSSFRLIDGDIFDSCTRTEIYATHIT